MKEQLKAISSILILSLLLISISCGVEDTNYKFKLINETNYHLNEIKLDCSQGDPLVIEVGPNKSLEFNFMHKTRKNQLFVEPQVCINLQTYSDTLKTYEYHYGISVPVHYLKKNETNLIKIKLRDPVYDSARVFDITTIN
jgi:hypothetical protein